MSVLFGAIQNRAPKSPTVLIPSLSFSSEQNPIKCFWFIPISLFFQFLDHCMVFDCFFLPFNLIHFPSKISCYISHVWFIACEKFIFSRLEYTRQLSWDGREHVLQFTKFFMDCLDFLRIDFSIMRTGMLLLEEVIIVLLFGVRSRNGREHLLFAKFVPLLIPAFNHYSWKKSFVTTQRQNQHKYQSVSKPH